MKDESLRVWLVDDDPSIRWTLERALRAAGMVARAFESGERLLAALLKDTPEVLLVDICMPGVSGFDVLRKVREHWPDVAVIMMTAHCDLPSAVKSYGDGAFEYLPKPFDVDRAIDLVRRAASGARRSKADGGAAPSGLALRSYAPSMQSVVRTVARVARSSCAVLIAGESGCGKELAARAIHSNSSRSAKPFTMFDTAAIPLDLVEQMFFGSEDDVAVGSSPSTQGSVEAAAGGTLYIRELADFPGSLQARFLKLLVNGTYHRAGGRISRNSDVRVIVATRRNLQDCVLNGVLLEELYHRVNGVRIDLPPLRARPEDIPQFVDYYLTLSAEAGGTPPKTLGKGALERLSAYGWPGNLHELVEVCKFLTLLAPGPEIRVEDLPPQIAAVGAIQSASYDWLKALTSWAELNVGRTEKTLLDELKPAFEQALIRVAMKHTQGHRALAAKVLGWGRNTLGLKIREHQMTDFDGEPPELTPASLPEARSSNGELRTVAPTTTAQWPRSTAHESAKRSGSSSGGSV